MLKKSSIIAILIAIFLTNCLAREEYLHKICKNIDVEGNLIYGVGETNTDRLLKRIRLVSQNKKTRNNGSYEFKSTFYAKKDSTEIEFMDGTKSVCSFLSPFEVDFYNLNAAQEYFILEDGKKILLSEVAEKLIWNSYVINENSGAEIQGFLNLSLENEETAVFYKGPSTEYDKNFDTRFNYGFYTIIDQHGSYYLLADFNRGYFDNKITGMEENRILGWVKKEYVELWSSLMYYRPINTRETKFVNESEEKDIIRKSLDPSTFDEVFPNLKKTGNKYDYPGNELYKYYMSFGLVPTVNQRSIEKANHLKVAFFYNKPSYIKYMDQKEIVEKSSLKFWYLIDHSESIKGLRVFVDSFHNSLENDKILNIDSGYYYSDVDGYIFTPNSIKYDNIGKEIFFDNKFDASEPLFTALKKLIEKESITENTADVVIIITDAGDNSGIKSSEIVEICINKKILLIFIAPDINYLAYIEDYFRNNNIKLPNYKNNVRIEYPFIEAYKDLRKVVKHFESQEVAYLDSLTFDEQSNNFKDENIVSKVKNLYKRLVTNPIINKQKDYGKDAIAEFLNENVYKKIKESTNTVLAKSVSIIENFDDDSIYEKRLLFRYDYLSGALKNSKKKGNIEFQRYIIFNTIFQISPSDLNEEYVKKLLDDLNLGDESKINNKFIEMLLGEKHSKSYKLKNIQQDLKDHSALINDRKFYFNCEDDKKTNKPAYTYLLFNELFEKVKK